MHALAKKFMMARKLDFGEKGTANLLDDQVFLMDGGMLTALEQESGSDAAYAVGQAAGRSLSDNIKETGVTGTKFNEFMMDLLTMMGLGDFAVHDFDITTKEGEVRVENCLPGREGEAGGCNVVAGVLAGVFGENYDTAFEVEEVGCTLDGDDLCQFKVQSSA